MAEQETVQPRVVGEPWGFRDGELHPPAPTRNGFFGKKREEREASTAVIIEARGGVEQIPVEDQLVTARSGVYHADPRRRVWVNEPIPAGWVWFYAENDPEPFTNRKPEGFTAKMLEWIIGDMPIYLISKGYAGRKEGLNLPEWLKNPWLVGGIAMGVVATGYMYWRKTQGG